jgi:hypothetical protein
LKGEEEVPDGDNGKGQIAEALRRLTGARPCIQIFLLDVGPEVRKEIQELKDALKELVETNLDRTITKRVVREAFSMGKNEIPEARLPEAETPKPDLSLLTPKERHLLTTRKWSPEDIVGALTLCNWDRKATAQRFQRNYDSLRVAISRNKITPPSGVWPAGPPTRGQIGWRKQLRNELSTKGGDP